MTPRGNQQNKLMREQALERISGAALRIFAEYGYHGATMKQIAQETGLSYGLVYHYFPSKAKLFHYLVDFALTNSLVGLTATLDTPGTAWERICALSEMLVQSVFTAESSLFFHIIFQAITQGKHIPDIPERIRAGIDAYYDALAPVVQAAQEAGEAVDGDPRVLAAAYLSSIQGLVTLTFQGLGMETQITADMLSNILRNGAQP